MNRPNVLQVKDLTTQKTFLVNRSRVRKVPQNLFRSEQNKNFKSIENNNLQHQSDKDESESSRNNLIKNKPIKIIDARIIPKQIQTSKPVKIINAKMKPINKISINENKLRVYSYKPKESARQIFVYASSIVDIEADAIVNAANENLQHFGGIAKVISKAAGPNFQRDSLRWTAQHGKLAIGNVVIIGGHNLHNTKIINVVGPNGNCIKDAASFHKMLEKSYRNVLGAAEYLKLSSITLPFISLGAFRGDFSKNYILASTIEIMIKLKNVFPSIKQIHFVDVEQPNVQLFDEIVKCTSKRIPS